MYKKVVADDGELESLYIEQEISHNNWCVIKNSLFS